ncbi:MAG TPA: 2-methylaconitate cis-trans isomerase PrpF [Limnochordales bacterium]
MEQLRIPAVIMRGGTSKGVFFRGDVLPSDPEVRDRVILRAFGSPDPYGRQIDGLGGATSTTSKVCIISPSTRPGCDVDYLFGQVSIDRPLIDYTGNCGNLSSAVGPFAIEEGMVKGTDPVTVVRIWQVNTQKLIVAHVPTRDGLPEVEGDYTIDGIPTPGAEIRLEFYEPGGSNTGKLLPTGRVVDELDIPGLGRVPVSMVDAANPAVFVPAEVLGLAGTELGDQVDGNPELLRRLELIRAHAAVAMGLARSPEEATRNRPATPKIAFVTRPQAYTTQKGSRVEEDQVDVVSRIMSMGKLHRAYAVTGAIATAMAAVLPGTVVNQLARLAVPEEVRIGHPAGVIKVGASVRQDNGQWTAVKAVVGRTARRLMEGWVRVPASVLQPQLAAAR